VSFASTVAAWLSLLAYALGGPWSPLVPLYLLLGSTGTVVGLASVLIERTWISIAALVVGSIAPITAVVVWVATGPHEI